MDSFLQELAQPRPDPGGGAAAAYGARLGLALLEKVVLLEGRRRRPPAGASAFTWEQALARLRRLSAVFSELQEADVQAYFKSHDRPGLRGPRPTGRSRCGRRCTAPNR